MVVWFCCVFLLEMWTVKEEVKACIVLNHLVSISRVVLIQIEKRIGVDMLKKAACFSLLRVGWVLWAGQGERRCATTIPAISKNSFPLPLPLFGLPLQPKKEFYWWCITTWSATAQILLYKDAFLTCPYPQHRITRQPGFLTCEKYVFRDLAPGDHRLRILTSFLGAWCCISGLTICVLKSVTALQEKSQNGVLVF